VLPPLRGTFLLLEKSGRGSGRAGGRSGTCPISWREATRLSVRRIKDFCRVTWGGDERHIAATRSTF
jgi:hypothetical protein